MQFCAGIATELQLRLMLLATVQLAAAVMLCDDLAQRASVEHRFQAFAHCRRSNKTQVGLANYRRIERCADLARQRRALAFNYAPINAAGRLRTERNGYDVPSDADNPHNYTFVATTRKSPTDGGFEFFNCEVLACPEWSDLADMLNDTRYDYYTMYANPAPPPNSTCLPGIGVFIYYNRFVNYSTAAATCRTPLAPHISRAPAGELANVMSARRTNAVAQLVRSQRPDTARLDVAYVGLNRSTQPHAAQPPKRRTSNGAAVPSSSQTHGMRTSAGESIDCFLYRAWSPGHPRIRATTGDRTLCVAVTRRREWRAYACSKRLPFVCELFSSRKRARPGAGGGGEIRRQCEGLPQQMQKNRGGDPMMVGKRRRTSAWV